MDWAFKFANQDEISTWDTCMAIPAMSLYMENGLSPDSIKLKNRFQVKY